MPPDSAEHPSRLAIAGIALGALSILTVVTGFIWMSSAEGEAVFGPMLIAGIVFFMVGAVGLSFAIAGLVRRARPRWMVVVGLALSAISLALGALYVFGIVAIAITLTNMTPCYSASC